MSKVNFDAKSEYDMVNNYKQLQAVFDKLKISRNIEVSKLVKGRPLDNLEFLQWMKHYYDTATGGVPPTDYDGEERRANCKGAAAMKRSTGGASSARASASRTAPTSRAAPSVAARRTTAATAPTTSAPTSATTNAKLAALQAENTELKLAVERSGAGARVLLREAPGRRVPVPARRVREQHPHKGGGEDSVFHRGQARHRGDHRGVRGGVPRRSPGCAGTRPRTRPREPAMVATKSEEEEEEVTTPTVAEAAAVALELAAEEPAAPSSAETVAAAANEELDVTADADVTMTAASPWLARNRRRRCPRCLPSPRRRRRWNPRVRWRLRRRRVSPCRRSRSTCETTSVDERFRARIPASDVGTVIQSWGVGFERARKWERTCDDVHIRERIRAQGDATSLHVAHANSSGALFTRTSLDGVKMCCGR